MNNNPYDFSKMLSIRKPSGYLTEFDGSIIKKIGDIKTYTNIKYTEDDFFEIDFLDDAKNKKLNECCLYIKEVKKFQKVFNDFVIHFSNFMVNDKGKIVFNYFLDAMSLLDFFEKAYCGNGEHSNGWEKDFIYGCTAREFTWNYYVKNKKSKIQNIVDAIHNMNHEKSIQSIYDVFNNVNGYESILKASKERIAELKVEKNILEKMKDEYIKTYSANLYHKKVGIDIFKFASKDNKYRPELTGVYYDPNGYVVATDCRLLYATRNGYDEAKSGKIFSKDGKEIEGKFVNWKTVFKNNMKDISFSPEKLLNFVTTHKKIRKFRKIENKNIGLSFSEYLYDDEELEKFLEASLLEKDVKFRITESGVITFLSATGSIGAIFHHGDVGGLFFGNYMFLNDYRVFLQNSYYDNDNLEGSNDKQIIKKKNHKGQMNNLPLVSTKVNSIVSNTRYVRISITTIQKDGCLLHNIPQEKCIATADGRNHCQMRMIGTIYRYAS